ncbi:hypothetical protein ACH5RR_028237 [Cinchona calisaya]|uniref:Non-haem dioxygenase N-terminal domain-containing protein n=1 Tax=Cinchona calisaya TaxID=153742 RepID=A0ABD2YN54_9GENT
MEKERVPIIDMQELSGLAEKIVKACEGWGCFRLLNHGVSLKLLSEMKVVCRSLLDLPLEIKKENSPPGHAGQIYRPPNEANRYFEGLSISDMTSPLAVDHFFTQVGVTPQQRDSILCSSSFCI